MTNFQLNENAVEQNYKCIVQQGLVYNTHNIRHERVVIILLYRMVHEKEPRPNFSSKKRSHVITATPMAISAARGTSIL